VVPLLMVLLLLLLLPPHVVVPRALLQLVMGPLPLLLVLLTLPWAAAVGLPVSLCVARAAPQHAPKAVAVP
jgi:hypothetical protein